MITLVASPGLVNSNTYCTEAEAEAYIETRLFTSNWLTASVADKRAALVWATRTLDSLVQWEGYQKYPGVQALQWPRGGLETRGGQAYLNDSVIPQELKDATTEFARQLLIADRTGDSDVETQGIRSLSVGPISLSFSDTVRAKVLPDAVKNLLVPEWVYRFTGRGSGLEFVDVERV